MDDLNINDILTSIAETAYVWDLQTDELTWSENVNEVLNISDTALISNGRAFGMMVNSEDAQVWSSKISSVTNIEDKKPTLYRIQYRLCPNGRNDKLNYWVEDHGCIYCADDGRPLRATGVLRLIDERYEEEQRLQYLSRHDELTGQINRNSLTKVVSQFFDESQNKADGGAFLLVAIDDLALINETFGFDTGDEVITAVAQKLRDQLRSPDSIGRYSSNKFGVVLRRSEPEQMQAAADRLSKLIRDEIIATSSGSVSVTVSIGGVLIPRHAKNVQEVISCSLEALDIAKANRQISFAAYKPSPKRESIRSRNIAIIDDTISALNDHRLLLSLQPIVSTEGFQTAFYECLLRKRNPDGTIVLADEFIPIVEQFGVCQLIDTRVLEMTIALLKSRPDLTISMNVSGRTASGEEWLSHLTAITQSDLSVNSRLIVEITETTAIGDMEASINFVKTLKSLGCRVAIDDFGTGHSSYRTLKALGVDILKIDGSFVRNLIDNSDDQIFLKTLVEMAIKLELETVAEWVTDKETADFLKAIGVDYLQGHYFGEATLVEGADRSASPEEQTSQRIANG